MGDVPPGRIEIERDAGVLTLRIANPDVANALDEPILSGLVAALHPDALRDVRAVLLGGAGDRHFSSGLNLRGADDMRSALISGERSLRAAADAIAAAPCPVIGVITGAAVGGAIELAAACDWRLAAEGARFAMPAARFGVAYSPEGLARMVALVGPARTKEIFLGGEPLDAERALAIGLVERVVPGERLWAEARAAAGAVAAAAPLAIRATRATVDALAFADPRPELTARAEERRRRAFASADLLEGLTAAREGRPPRFTGA